jgi:hypothetical protein
MQRIKFISNLLLFCFLLSSCGSLSETASILRNEKVSNSDEFLIKKRNPLAVPPDYETIPEPEMSSVKKNNKTSFEKILRPSDEVQKNKKSSSVEESILIEIRK